MLSNTASRLQHCKRDPVSRQYGGPGNDAMTGLRGDDLLIGGPGRDVAFGLAGVDTCRAEFERRCER